MDERGPAVDFNNRRLYLLQQFCLNQKCRPIYIFFQASSWAKMRNKHELEFNDVVC